MIDCSNLRRDLPAFHSAALYDWHKARENFAYTNSIEVPCCMNIHTREMLFKVIRSMGAKSVLDIGTYVGVSALNYAMAVGIGGGVTTVDVKDVNAPDGYWFEAGMWAKPFDMVSRAGVSHRVDFIIRDSVEFMRECPYKFDFISIDGWHEDHQVYKEIELAMGLLRPNGLIFMDDVMEFDDPARPKELDYIYGPHKALQKHLDQGLDVQPVMFNQLNGSWVANAFLIRKE